MTIPQLNFREPKTIVRLSLAVLLLANIVASVFAFHIFGDSPAGLDAQLAAMQNNLRAAELRLNRTRMLAANMQKSKGEGDKFLASYMTTRKHTYSTIDAEINQLATSANMKVGDLNYALLDPIEGSGDLDMLTITANFEGGYAQLVKFVNLLDRSPRFLLIEGLQVAPQPKGDILSVTVKLNTFVRDDNGGAQ